ncbi:MAG: efflux RND transporter periplasmic adaptor subunit [Bacteroidales bacterium]|nr:efflux RND transporter periplasmic adaptor subunit [Bacteroidales bacterium]
MKRYISILVIAIIPTWVLTSCAGDDKPEKAENVVNVETITVKQKQVKFPIHTSGKLKSPKELRLSFKTGGIIQSIEVDEGEMVNKGDAMARLDLSEIRAKVRQAELAVEKAERDLKRTKNLYQDSVATLEDYQNAKTALNLAEADYEAALFNLNHSSIKAPANGKVLKTLMEANEMVGPGTPVILFGVMEGRWKMNCNLSDKDVIKVKAGDTAHIHFDPYPNQVFRSTVKQIAGTADPYTGTYEVELRLDPVEVKLASGFIGKVDIYPTESDLFMVIPNEAMIDASGTTAYVYSIEDNRPVRRKIIISRLTGEKLYVKSGVAPGMTLITKGVNYIDSKSKINVMKPEENK